MCCIWTLIAKAPMTLYAISIYYPNITPNDSRVYRELSHEEKLIIGNKLIFAVNILLRHCRQQMVMFAAALGRATFECGEYAARDSYSQLEPMLIFFPPR